MTTLRDIMTSCISGSGWLDDTYKRDLRMWQLHQRESIKYSDWLSALNDDDFLDAYNRVQQAQYQLDYNERVI